MERGLLYQLYSALNRLHGGPDAPSESSAMYDGGAGDSLRAESAVYGNSNGIEVTAPPGRRDVLVGSLRDGQQYALCRKYRFYYIPAERIPEEFLPIRYVALFKTPGVFGERAGIELYGEVTATSLVRRKRITEVPLRRMTDAERLYYRFEIRRWLRLDPPVEPKDHAFVSDFTTLPLLKGARYVPELFPGRSGKRDQ